MERFTHKVETTEDPDEIKNRISYHPTVEDGVITLKGSVYEEINLDDGASFEEGQLYLVGDAMSTNEVTAILGSEVTAYLESRSDKPHVYRKTETVEDEQEAV